MENIGKKIIEELEKITPIEYRKNTIVAGQAVAEIYFRLLNIPFETRIKDIDLYTTEDEYLKEKIYLNKTLNYKISHSKVDYHAESMRESKNLIIGNVLIKNTYNLKKINVVEVELLNTTNLLESVVNIFDLNSVQIGVCLLSGKLYMTEHFKKFIETKQVEIVNCHKPVSTLYRFLKKREYYKGAYFNVDKELNKIILAIYLNKINNTSLLNKFKIEKEYFLKVKNAYEIKNISMLKERYLDLSEESRLIIDSKFKTEECHFYGNNLYEDNLSQSSTEFIDKVISYNNLDINKDNFKILKYRTKNIIEYLKKGYIKYSFKYFKYNENNIFKGFFLDIIESRKVYFNFEDISEAKIKEIETDVIKFIPFEAKSGRRFYNIKDKEFKYADYVVNNGAILSKSTIVNYKKDISVLKFEPIENSNNDFMKKNINLLIDVIFDKHPDLFSELIRSHGINLKFIDFILKPNLENIINEKFSKLIHLNKVGIYNVITYLNYYLLDTKEDLLKIKNSNIALLLENKDILLNVYFNKEVFNVDINKVLDRIKYFYENNYRYIIGSFESGKLHYRDFFNDIDDLIKEVKLKEGDLFKDVPEIPKEYLVFKSYKINQILNGIELKQNGAEMKHCIGGYTNDLITMKSFFFNVYDKNNIRYSLRLEKVIKNGHNGLYFNECKGKLNKIPNEKVIKDLIDFSIYLEKLIQNNKDLENLLFFNSTNNIRNMEMVEKVYSNQELLEIFKDDPEILNIFKELTEYDKNKVENNKPVEVDLNNEVSELPIEIIEVENNEFNIENKNLELKEDKIIFKRMLFIFILLLC